MKHMGIVVNFAENLNDLMLDNNLSVKTFSEKLGLNMSECYKYLRNEYLPCLANIIKIADYFECSIDYLLGLEESNYLKFSHTPPFDRTFAKLLEDKNLTRYQLNKHTKISNSRIDDWYHGRRLPSIDNLIVLAKYFDCSIDTLLARY